MNAVNPAPQPPIKSSEITELVTLPSHGLGYSPELNIPEQVTMRPMKAQEEKICFSANYDLNKLITVLLSRCLLDGFDPSELYEGDRLYLLFKLRSITYTDKYHVSGTCKCGTFIESQISLDNLEVKEIVDESELFSQVTLPSSKYVVTLKSLTGKDTEAIIRRTKQNKEDSYIELLTSRISNIEGYDKSYAVYKRLVNDLIGKDSATLREAINKLSFGIIGGVSENCPSCGTANLLSIEVTEEFFRPQM